MNLSNNFILNQAEIELLSHGLTFIPTPQYLDKNSLRKDLHTYHRRLKILDFFDYNNTGEFSPFQSPSSWDPPESEISKNIKELCQQDAALLERTKLSSRDSPGDNISSDQRKALEQLQKNELIVIKPADKGSMIVVMDRAQYLREAERQLSITEHYIPLDNPIQAATRNLQDPILDKLKSEGYITERQRRFLIGPDEPRDRLFYLLPKVHKKVETWPLPGIPPGRPIISDCGSESYHIAQYIEYFLNPISQRHQSYIKDTYDFVTKIRDRVVSENSILFTIDITSLYTNIDTNLGLRAVREAFEEYPDSSRPDEAILELLHLGLTRNDFCFNGKYFLQVHGTAMGKTFAPSYANIYMASWERTAFPKCRFLPELYFRYLDDLWGLWSYGVAAFEEFVQILNTHHPSIKVTSNVQLEQLEFLDTEVFFVKGEIEGMKKLATRVFFKSTDTHALLHKSSFHPKHTFRGIIKSQLIRFRRICSLEVDVEKATRVLFAALRPRGYTRRFLRGIKSEVRRSFEQYQTIQRTPEEKNLIPFVHTFHSNLAGVNKNLKRHFNHCQAQIPGLQTFRFISAYRRNKNLKDMLVHTRLDRPQRQTGPFLFPKYVTNLLTGKGAPIARHLSPNSLNVIYAIKCKTCGAMYIGETKHSMKVRLQQHLYYIRKKKDRGLYKHFQIHSVDQLQMIGLQSDNSWNKQNRLNWERKWMLKLNTIDPWGLNEKW